VLVLPVVMVNSLLLNQLKQLNALLALPTVRLVPLPQQVDVPSVLTLIPRPILQTLAPLHVELVIVRHATLMLLLVLNVSTITPLLVPPVVLLVLALLMLLLETLLAKIVILLSVPLVLELTLPANLVMLVHT